MPPKFKIGDLVTTSGRYSPLAVVSHVSADEKRYWLKHCSDGHLKDYDFVHEINWYRVVVTFAGPVRIDGEEVEVAVLRR